jgi:hypothetical protein
LAQENEKSITRQYSRSQGSRLAPADFFVILGGPMKYYFKFTIILAIILLTHLAHGQEKKLNAFIDQLVSAPFLIDDITDSSFTAQSYLFDLSKRDLRLIRNAIFASRGYIFVDADLKEYFSNKKWYKPTINNISEINLTDVDKANIKFIKGLESDPSFADFLKLFNKSGKLPLTILAREQNNSDVSGAFKIPPQYLIKFLKIKPLVDTPNYPEHVVSLDSNIIGIIYRESIPAGGYCELYYLVTFTPQGELIDKLQIGRATGDSGQYTESKIDINEKLMIHIQNIRITGNEEWTKEIRKVYRDVTYSITANGMFHELPTNKAKSGR